MKKFAVVLVLALVAATAFAQTKFTWLNTTSDDPDRMLPGVRPAAVQGNIVTAGSSTVYPLSEAVSEAFKRDGYTGNITIDSIGSGAGFERFGKGELDISNASAQIKAAQITAAETANAGKVLEFLVGVDALTIVVSKRNTFATNLTTAEIKLAFSTAEFWSDVRATFPRQPIKRFIPGTASGTFSYFVEHFFAKDNKPILAARNLNLNEDDNVLVRGVGSDQYAIGFFGFAYFDENRTTVNAVSVDGVAPSAQTVANKTYSVARPLYLYTTDSIIKSKPQVAAFINYYLSNVNRLIRRVGYFPVDANVAKASKQLWLDTLRGMY